MHGEAAQVSTGDQCLLPFGGDVELEENDVPVIDGVVLPFLAVLSGRLDSDLASKLVQFVVLHHLGADETSLKIGVNRARCLGSLVPLSNGPTPHFVRSRGEEVDQMDGPEARDDDLWQGTLAIVLLAVDGFLILRHVKEGLLQLSAEGDHLLSPVLGDPLVDFGQKLVLFSNVILLAQVDQVDDGFGREQLLVVDVFDLVHAPILLVPHILPFLEPLQDDFAGGELFLLFLLEPSGDHLVEVFDGPLDHLYVFEPQFLVDDLRVFHGIDAILHVYDFHVLERSAHVKDPVHGPDVGQEGVS
eukprot:scaffold877_cov314-Pavlova_lutheri.AAC.3